MLIIRMPWILPISLLAMTMLLLGCAHQPQPSGNVRPQTSVEQKLCVARYFKSIPLIIPDGARPGDVVDVPVPECVRAALRQWTGLVD